MSKSKVFGVAAAGLIIFSFITASLSNQAPDLESSLNENTTTVIKEVKNKAPLVCDGTVIIKDCIYDGITYKTYIFHPEVPEKSHNETITTYREEVTGYCTLCNDGTYSPSCATGRGACSHHDGVAQWNAPITTQVPVYTTNKVIDQPAVASYIEKL